MPISPTHVKARHVEFPCTAIGLDLSVTPANQPKTQRFCRESSADTTQGTQHSLKI